MPRWLHAIRTRLSRGTAIWAGLCILFGLGLLTTIIDLSAMPGWELREANSNGQRVIIDPETGAVSGSAHDEAAFEVSEEAPPEDMTAAPAEEEPVVDEASPTIDGPALRTEAEPVTLPDVASSSESIVAPPAPEITELGKEPLPKRGEKDATASKLYARLFQRQADTAYITILITDAGFNAATLSQILKLPHQVTVAFSPYALDPKPQIALMHTAGFETWGMLPVQSARFPQDDPGPLGILIGQKESEQTKRLKKVMSSTLGAVGLVLPSEEAIGETEDFKRVLKEIDARGLFLLSTHPTRTVSQLTKDDELKKIIRRADLVLDSTASAAFIQSKLAGLPALAKQQKAVIVVASARPQTLRILADWLKSEPLGAGVELAPLSSMYGPDAPPPPPEPEKKEAGGHGAGEEKPVEEKPESHGGGH